MICWLVKRRKTKQGIRDSWTWGGVRFGGQLPETNAREGWGRAAVEARPSRHISDQRQSVRSIQQVTVGGAAVGVLEARLVVQCQSAARGGVNVKRAR